MTARFAGKCTACSHEFATGASILWAKGAGAKHATLAACEAAKAAAAVAVAPKPAVVHVGEFAGVIALFEAAKLHLKFPKIRLVCAGTKIVLALNGPRAKNPGAVSICGEGRYPNRAYFGRVSPDGSFSPFKLSPVFEAALTALLAKFSADPAGVAKEHGKLTGHCCFCNLVLGLGEDKRSVAVGFGPKCAEHYNLKEEWLRGVAAVPMPVEPAAAPVAAPVTDLAALAFAVAAANETGAF
jgi:hypothetical protein